MMEEKITLDSFIARIEKNVCEALGITPLEIPQNAEIEAICARNRSREWIFSDKRYLTSYEVERKKKYPFGLVEVHLSLARDQIQAIKILGDFFGTEPIETLENALVGMDVNALSFIDPSPYIGGMTFEELCDLLK